MFLGTSLLLKKFIGSNKSNMDYISDSSNRSIYINNSCSNSSGSIIINVSLSHRRKTFNGSDDTIICMISSCSTLISTNISSSNTSNKSII